jgi:HSP20 family protein
MNGWYDTDARMIDQFRSRLGRLFSDFLEDSPSRFGGNGFSAERVFPPINLWEDEGNVYAECELPGVQMEDLDVTVVGRDLSIKGQRMPKEFEGAPFHRRERDVGSFHRVVHLPIDIDSKKVSAELQHGVLTMTLPKAAQARPRKIEVKCLTAK